MENSTKIHSGFVALIGRPNVGKSTLMNALIGQKIAAVSNRAQTTRKRIQTVYTSDEGQIVFLDTPGITRAKNKLGDYMLEVSGNAMSEVDVILWLVEPTTLSEPANVTSWRDCRRCGSRWSSALTKPTR